MASIVQDILSSGGWNTPLSDADGQPMPIKDNLKDLKVVYSTIWNNYDILDWNDDEYYFDAHDAQGNKFHGWIMASVYLHENKTTILNPRTNIETVEDKEDTYTCQMNSDFYHLGNLFKMWNSKGTIVKNIPSYICKDCEGLD